MGHVHSAGVHYMVQRESRKRLENSELGLLRLIFTDFTSLFCRLNREEAPGDPRFSLRNVVARVPPRPRSSRAQTMIRAGAMLTAGRRDTRLHPLTAVLALLGYERVLAEWSTLAEE